MKPNIILSIHHKWAELILDGKKTVELRKSLPRTIPGKVYLYDTKEKKITGYFLPQRLRKEGSIIASIENVFERSLLSKEEYRAYWGMDAAKNHDWRRWYEIEAVSRIKPLIPLPPGVKAPRNFVYCGELQCS